MRPELNKYKVLVRGQNFLLNVDGSVGKFGFFTTRFAEADTPAQAEETAILALRADSTLRSNTLNDEADTPMLFVEDIEELDSFDGITPPGAGFSFYREDASA